MTIMQGNALFDVAGNRERPFLIETEEVRIEVLGTMFHVKSDVGSTFELSVQRGKVKVALKNKNQEMYVNEEKFLTRPGITHIPTVTEDPMRSVSRRTAGDMLYSRFS